MYRWSVIGCACTDSSLSSALLELETQGWEIFQILHDVDPRKAREDAYRIVSRRLAEKPKVLGDEYHKAKGTRSPRMADGKV